MGLSSYNKSPGVTETPLPLPVVGLSLEYEKALDSETPGKVSLLGEIIFVCLYFYLPLNGRQTFVSNCH